MTTSLATPFVANALATLATASFATTPGEVLHVFHHQMAGAGGNTSLGEGSMAATGATFTNLGSVSHNGSGSLFSMRETCWRVVAPGSTMTITATRGSNVTYQAMHVVRVSNATTESGSFNSGTHDLGDVSITLSPAPSASSCVLTCYSNADTGGEDIAPPSGMTELAQDHLVSGLVPCQICYDDSSPPASYSWDANDRARALAVEVKVQTSSHYSLTADAGSVAASGSAATLRSARKMTAAAASFALTGSDAALLWPTHYSLAADAGAYGLTGFDVATIGEAYVLENDGLAPVVAGIGGVASGTGDGSVPMPDGIQAGDDLLLVIESSGGTFETPEGWTSLGAFIPLSYWKIADGSESGVELSLSEAADHWQAMVLAGRNVRAGWVLSTDAEGSDDTIELPSASSSSAASHDFSRFMALVVHSEETSFSGAAYANAPEVSAPELIVFSPTSEGDGGTLAIWTATRGSSGSSGVFSATAADAGDWSGRRLTWKGDYDFKMTLGEVTFDVARHLGADVAAFDLTGADAAMCIELALAAEEGVYALAGEDVEFIAGPNLAAEAGAFALAGADATLRAVRTMAAAAGSLALAGSPAGLKRAYVVAAEAASLALTGASAGLVRARTLAAEAGAVALTGADAALRSARRLVAAAASYALTGLGPALVLERPVTTPARRQLRLTGPRSGRVLQLTGGKSGRILQLTGGKAGRTLRITEV